MADEDPWDDATGGEVHRVTEEDVDEFALGDLADQNGAMSMEEFWDLADADGTDADEWLTQAGAKGWVTAAHGLVRITPGGRERLQEIRDGRGVITITSGDLRIPKRTARWMREIVAQREPAALHHLDALVSSESGDEDDRLAVAAVLAEEARHLPPGRKRRRLLKSVEGLDGTQAARMQDKLRRKLERRLR